MCRNREDGDIKLSVIMLAYNQAPYIHQAIDSVLRQRTNFKFEILIGDDASSDESASIIREYAGQYPQTVIPVIRETNCGATRNLYELMERARGDYLAYLECDDFWCNDMKLQQQVDFLEDHPEYIACTHRITLVDQKGVPYDQRIDWISDQEEYTIADFKGIVLPGHGNSMVHRNIFRNSQGKYKDLIVLHPMIADRSLCLLLASQGPIRQIQKVMGCYRQPSLHRKSATAVLYESNPNKVLDDYFFTKQLEAYANENLQGPVDFEPHKKQLLVDAVVTALRWPNRCNLSIAAEMLHNEHSPEYIKCLIDEIIRKFKAKIR